MPPAVTLLAGGELFAPQPLGARDLLIVGTRVSRLPKPRELDLRALRALDDAAEVIDAAGCDVVPGFVDPHAHLIGAGGEQGFATRMPEMSAEQIALSGVTTIVGCLGTDAIGRDLGSLLAKARQLDAQGLNTFVYTGSFQVPPPTLTGSVMRDVVLIDKCVGAGEVAIADVRASQPTTAELARIVADAAVGGKIAGKAGVTHFHVGPAVRRLAPLRALLEEFDVEPERLYPTHVSRTRELMDEAIALAGRGCNVDTDTVEPDTAKWLGYYLEHGGPPDRLSFSSDAHTPGGSTENLFRTFAAAVLEHRLPLERVLPHFSTNAAAALKLAGKGRIEPGADADLLVLRRRSLEVVHVIARGRVIVRDGRAEFGGSQGSQS